MAEQLKSDLGLAQEHSENLLTTTIELAELPSVEAGETNHEVNANCQEAYTGLASCLDSYLEVAERDAGRIKATGIHFLNVDIGLAHGM